MTDEPTRPSGEEETADKPEKTTPNAEQRPKPKRRQRRRGGVRPGQKPTASKKKESGKEAALRGAREALAQKTGVPLHTLEGDSKSPSGGPKEILEGIPKLVEAMAETVANGIRAAVLEQMAAHEKAQGKAPTSDAAQDNPTPAKDPAPKLEEADEPKATDDAPKQKIPSVQIDPELIKESAGQFFNSLLGTLMQVASTVHDAASGEGDASPSPSTKSTDESPTVPPAADESPADPTTSDESPTVPPAADEIEKDEA